MILLAMSGWATAGWTALIIVLSAYFVAAEFALMAAKPHRLEEAAGTAAGRAAVKNSHELTLVLAGSQLGITVCTLALGAITKPAVHHALVPLLERGLPPVAADAAAFVLALILVTFLHLVVGEMAPKSWAIAHPEQSSLLLAIPLRAYMWVTRPVLRAMNSAANWLVRRAGAEPRDELTQGQDAAGLRHLVEHSANVGALEASYRGSLASFLTLRETTVAELLPDGQQWRPCPSTRPCTTSRRSPAAAGTCGCSSATARAPSASSTCATRCSSPTSPVRPSTWRAIPCGFRPTRASRPAWPSSAASAPSWRSSSTATASSASSPSRTFSPA